MHEKIIEECFQQFYSLLPKRAELKETFLSLDIYTNFRFFNEENMVVLNFADDKYKIEAENHYNIKRYILDKMKNISNFKNSYLIHVSEIEYLYVYQNGYNFYVMGLYDGDIKLLFSTKTEETYIKCNSILKPITMLDNRLEDIVYIIIFSILHFYDFS